MNNPLWLGDPKSFDAALVAPHIDYLADFPYLGLPHDVQIPQGSTK
jgi:hypothetical protein